MVIGNKCKLVMIGDSITDSGRGRPIGEGLFGAIGNGYAGLVSGLIGSTYPEKEIRIVNMGCSGDTVRELKARWDSDVLQLKPDWLSIMIGINDVWRQLDLPLMPEAHICIEEYSNTLEDLIQQTLPTLKGLILMTPFFIESCKNDRMRSTMDAYGNVVRELAVKYNAVFVDTQAAFDGLLEHFHSSSLAWDRVHPNVTGHMVIARAFLKAIGYCW